MQTIPISSIQIPENRQRREFDPAKMFELMDSIKRVGLLHPIILRDGKTLVAGERRFRAIRDLYALGGSFRHASQEIPHAHIPYLNLGDLSPLEAEEAELEENIIRDDLRWQERTQAVARLHALRSAQAAERGETHTLTDTAEEIHGRGDGGYREAVRQDVILAQNLSNPDVAKAKTPKDAYKALKRDEVRKENIQLAAAIGQEAGSDLYRLVHGDCLEVMAQMEPGQFDCILTDPPYGMGAHEFGDSAGKLSAATHLYDDSYEAWVPLMKAAVPLILRLAKPQAHLFMFCDFDRFHELKGMIEEAGKASAWKVFRTPIINYKADGNRTPWPLCGPQRKWEMLLYAVKMGRPIQGHFPDLIESRLTEPSLGMGAQKPVEFLRRLLSVSCRPGDSVFDPFAGTGSIFPAAAAQSLRVVGIEKEAAYYGLAASRIQALQADRSGGAV